MTDRNDLLALRDAGHPLWGTPGLALLDDLTAAVTEARDGRRDRLRAAHEWADSYLAYDHERWDFAGDQPDLVMMQDLTTWRLVGWWVYRQHPTQDPLPRYPVTPRGAIQVGCYLALYGLFLALWDIHDRKDRP